MEIIIKPYDGTSEKTMLRSIVLFSMCIIRRSMRHKHGKILRAGQKKTTNFTTFLAMEILWDLSISTGVGQQSVGSRTFLWKKVCAGRVLPPKPLAL